MAEIFRFSTGSTTRAGYKRVRRFADADIDSDQLGLFEEKAARVLRLPSSLSPFEEALLLDERGSSGAVDSYLRAVEEDDCPADAYCNLGVLETERGDTDQALEHFVTCLQLNAAHPEAHYNLGNLYFDLGYFRASRVEYEMAASLNPSFPNVFFNLALLREVDGSDEAAKAALDRYKELVEPQEAKRAEAALDEVRRSLSTLR